VSSIEYKVCTKITQRAALGKEKYGTTMDRDDLSSLEWLIHAQEEAMDLSVYLEKLIGLEQELLLAKKLIDEAQKKQSCKNCRCQGGISEWTRTSSLEELDSKKS
jgi:hypothetical protein|tara:strand:- start:4018 stop:4332 length:315 start_codon:yes stop_codon:yes gene_type:complete